jgi:hypothetical protein
MVGLSAKLRIDSNNSNPHSAGRPYIAERIAKLQGVYAESEIQANPAYLVKPISQSA